jgi:hypothetical protein
MAPQVGSHGDPQTLIEIPKTFALKTHVPLLGLDWARMYLLNV